VIQCVARFHATPTRRRATRRASSLTSRGVSPSATLTSAASASVHRLVGVPNVRGLWCHSARRASQTPGVKIADVVCGRDDGGWSPARPRWWNACMVLRTVWSVQCKWRAMVVVDCPSARARRIGQRRTVQADGDRSPVSSEVRSTFLFSVVCDRAPQPPFPRPSPRGIPVNPTPRHPELHVQAARWRGVAAGRGALPRGRRKSALNFLYASNTIGTSGCRRALTKKERRYAATTIEESSALAAVCSRRTLLHHAGAPRE
jgi:hypothetical protein